MNESNSSASAAKWNPAIMLSAPVIFVCCEKTQQNAKTKKNTNRTFNHLKRRFSTSLP